MPTPTISLIIPAYNEERYIGETLDFVVRNSHGTFLEIIVIDNASTDRTGEIASKVPDVRVVREDQKGLTRARERGRIEAKGEVIAYIDADTRMPEGWCEKILKEFAADSSLACLSGPYTYYDISKWQQFLVGCYWRLLGIPMYFLTGYMAVGGNFAIRASVLKAMGGFDTSIPFYSEDTNIARRAHQFGKVKFMLGFTIATSGRRFREQGFFRTAITYIINFLSEVLLHKPATKTYRDIR